MIPAVTGAVLVLLLTAGLVVYIFIRTPVTDVHSLQKQNHHYNNKRSKLIQKKHSLYYIYTALSKPVDLPGIYQFTAMGLLDDRQIDYYNKEDSQTDLLKEKMQEDYWEKGTQSRKSKEQWFNVSINIVMKRMGHNESDLHVLQWRHGCEVEQQGSELVFSKGISEYAYDGDNFLSFDDKESQWIAFVDAAVPIKRKFDNVPILNQYTKGYLEKECVDWLNKFREYADEELRNGTPPDVHVFAKRHTSEKTKLKLTCMATGFYPRDLMMTIREYRTSLPEDEVESTGIRPNHDGTFQLRKSVEINKAEVAEYDCFVTHKSIKEPVITEWGHQKKTTESLPACDAYTEEPVLEKGSGMARECWQSTRQQHNCVLIFSLSHISFNLDILKHFLSALKDALQHHQQILIFRCIAQRNKICHIHTKIPFNMQTSVTTKMFTRFCVFLLYGTLPSLQAEKHSLYYIYTALSKPVDLLGIYQFTAMGLLDDIQIDYYNKKMQEDYWEKGTQSRKSKEQWFNVNIDILMKRMGHNESDLHVLQWRHGCEVEQQGSELVFSKGISEYAYDGDNFLSFDDKESQWVAPVDAALPTKRKWDNVPILNQYTKGYLEKECVDWLNKFREYAGEELRKASSTDVHVFARKSSDETKLKLSCMATGFYAKDVMMTIRKYCTSLPEDETESTGVRPNHDGTFQLKKSVEIQEDEKAEYDCFVSHRTFKSITLKLGQATESLNAETPAGRERAGEKSDSSMSVLPEKVIQRDDIQIDYYNSVEQKKIPKQTWMKEKMQEDYWEKGTQSRKSKEQWFNVNIDILMNRMGHNESDLHVLQWRHGCEVEQQGSEFVFSKGINEYAYDGNNFLSFDDKESQWVAPVDAALPTKRKWDNVPILNQYTKGYLEKECVDWLNKFREYGDEELRKASSPDVHVFARKSSDETKLKLTCMATGFYAKDVMMTIRKYCTSLPENEVESTGIRPNHDGTFQLKKSVEIQEDEKAEYSCFVSHRTFKSITLKLGRERAGEKSDSSVTVLPEKVIQSEKHSLYYIYTALSKPVDLPGIYQFTAMGLLDDIQIDYYNSKEQKKIPKQTWMKEKMQEDYWEKGTQSRKSKEQWFNVNVDILMKRMGHNESDLHVLQWRHGCEVEQQGDEVNFSKGINEYAYDGENFLSFDDKESQWVALVDAALPTKRKWDNVPILNQYTKGYLEKECVDWLNKFREYADKELRHGSTPAVHVSIKDKSKLKLICLATGFYPRDVTMGIRKSCKSLPEDEVESTGIRPNHDESYQLRKSVEIKEDEKAEYDCFVSHRALKEPIIITWGN
ncbi:hypothetical protein H4Q32_027789 [Labeo rohita]|uniref:Ig-like domain-containing protein n=1 Tax=Labeo rohita TaxID=84645 RepID=A0ABQ8MW47_LABRO|nr:hypothetical protein H4Q32_027789 [Labeo rohita]